ncbi:MAG: VCBS repeat-containing protein, partial [Bdellovibrionales bacterium]|nr:VCBS repeat-containing protein [Bdellovibrionales bacterium]
QFLADPTSPHVASNDGYFHNNAFYPNSGWQVYNFDMTDTSQFAVRNGTWANDLFTLRLDPSQGAPAGSTLNFDWLRLVDPDSAPKVNVTWNSSGTSLFTVITVYVDNNTRGRDGSVLARFVSGNNPGTLEVPTAILPEGDHYFYVCAQDVGLNNGPTNCSGYSARLRILAKPRVTITAPSPTSGFDYASSVVGDAWDMANVSDVANLEGNCASQRRPEVFCLPTFRQFSNNSFLPSSESERGGAVFSATADLPLAGAAETDAQLHFQVAQGSPITPSQFRYLVYRMKVDDTGFGGIDDKLRRGWVSRPVFWNTDVVADGGRVKAHIVYEGWKTYVIDLWNPLNAEFVPGFADPTQYSSFSRLLNFSIHPLETAQLTNFALDYALLVSENYPTDNAYTITYDISDADTSNGFSVEIYFDTDNEGFNGTRITRLTGQTSGSHSFDWDTSALPEGQSYYVYLVVSDGDNTTRVYSDAPVRIGTFAPQPAPRLGQTPFDYDGDGVSDQAVYRPAAGQFFQNRTSQGVTTLSWGGATFLPLHADVDGDGTTDAGLVTDINGTYFWYFTRSSDGALYAPVWGVTGDTIVLGDYDGDGTDDVAVWRAGTWFILYTYGALGVGWGLPGDVPMPRDYDADGKDDLAIWRPSDGNWWIINSSTGFASVVQWGLPGDTPVAADWTGDGRADTAVWRAADGTWYIRNIATEEVTATQWGLPGDVPMVGDYNGDGTLDLTVYRAGVGTWFHNFRNGLSSAVQFGLPGDLLPQKAQ